MKFKKFIRSSLLRTAIYYTVLVFVFSLIIAIVHSGEEHGAGLDSFRILMFLPFCFLLGCANTLLKCERPDPIVRWILHFLLTVGGIFFFLLLPAGIKGSAAFTGLILIIAIYVVAAVIIGVNASRLKKTIAKDKKLRSRK